MNNIKKYQSQYFMIGIIDLNDFRIGCISSENELAKWTFPDHQDVSFTRQDLEELRSLISELLVDTDD